MIGLSKRSSHRLSLNNAESYSRSKRTVNVSVRSTALGWLLGFFVFVVFAALIPLALGFQVSEPQINVASCLAYLSVVYSAVHLTVLVIKGYQKLISLTFWMFCYIWMGLAPLLQTISNHFPWPGNYSTTTLAYAMFVTILGYIAYDVGKLLAVNQSDVLNQRSGSGLVIFSRKRIYLLSLLALPLTLLVIHLIGGVETLFMSRVAFGEQIRSGFGSAGAEIVSSLLRAPLVVSSIMLIWVWKNRTTLHLRKFEKMMLVSVMFLLLVLALLVDNPISSARYMVGTVILGLLFITLPWSRRSSMFLWIVVLFVGLVLVFPYAALFRNTTNPSLNFVPVVAQLTGSGDYDAFQSLVNTIKFVNYNGVTYGVQLLGVILFWVPRVVWPSKPIGTGQLVAEHAGYSFTNLSSPLWAEGFVNFGILGVILFMTIYGFGSGVLEQKYLYYRRNNASVLSALVPLLAAYQIFFVRGTLISTFAYIIPFVLYMSLAFRKSRCSSFDHSDREAKI